MIVVSPLFLQSSHVASPAFRTTLVSSHLTVKTMTLRLVSTVWGPIKKGEVEVLKFFASEIGMFALVIDAAIYRRLQGMLIRQREHSRFFG